MKNKGWTKFYREQFNHWVSEKKPWCDGYAWTCLYNMANHKQGEVNFRNEYIPVDRGQFITSKLKLENTFGWTRRRLDNFLKALENDEMITYRMTNRYTVITIINYEIYQSDGKQDNKQNDKQVTDRLQTGDKQVSTNKNDNNGNNVKNEKKKYMDAVYLTKEEHQKLINVFGKDMAKDKIVELNNSIMSKGYKYKSHYHTILCWDRKNKKGDQNGRSKQNIKQPERERIDQYEKLEETY